MKDRQDAELQWAAEYARYMEDEEGGMEFPERPAAQSETLRMHRRSYFVAEVAGVLRLCPVKDNMDAVESHESFASLKIVTNAAK